MPSCSPAALSEFPRRFREHYFETTHAMEDVAAPGYFAPAVHALAVGDLIKVRAALPDALVYEEFLVTHADIETGEVRIAPRHGDATGCERPLPARKQPARKKSV